MNEQRAFLDIPRLDHVYRPVDERERDFAEVEMPLSDEQLRQQTSRCMNCGIPFCHGTGCPLDNLIPDFNAAVHRGDWRQAWELLSSTSPFPEFTSRVCPALCEGSCTASMNCGAVTIRQVEKAIVERAFANGWVQPDQVTSRSGRRVAIVGGGPAGMSTAVILNRLGHNVTVYEKNAGPGGLMRYGIPDFKLFKQLIERRVQIMKKSGIRFVCDTDVGRDVSACYLTKQYDHLVLSCGTPVARDLSIPGRDLQGIHLALDFLAGQNRANAGELPAPPIAVKGQRVLVIGGGDTGSDCVGTSHRQGAASVTQIEIMPQPPATRSSSTPWPLWPYLLRTSSSHEEGCERRWDLSTTAFVGDNGRVSGAKVRPVSWTCSPEGRPLKFTPAGSEEVIACDVVFLALGFIKQSRQELLEQYGLADSPAISICGDAANGPSLVVRAIADGMAQARAIDTAW
ncbi:MAG: glutamate synthase subunit beta [Lentisphaeria bacterium]|nr:glutamate synthase subunit beta [Lentisphaeria bacterium]